MQFSTSCDGTFQTNDCSSAQMMQLTRTISLWVQPVKRNINACFSNDSFLCVRDTGGVKIPGRVQTSHLPGLILEVQPLAELKTVYFLYLIRKAIRLGQPATEKKSGAKRVPLFRRKQLHLWKWCQNSAMGGAALHTMKWLQGWSRFGSTIFLSVELCPRVWSNPAPNIEQIQNDFSHLGITGNQPPLYISLGHLSSH